MRDQFVLSRGNSASLIIGVAAVVLLAQSGRARAEVAYAFGSTYEDLGTGKILAATDVRPMPEQLLLTLSNEFEDFDLDLASGKIYYLDGSDNTVKRANLDGTSPQTLVSGLSGVGGLGLDLVNGKVYFGDPSANLIRRANLNGTSPETVISGVLYPSDIAIDAAGGKLYWADLDDAALRRADLDGTDVETIANGSPGISPTSVALDLAASKVYWADLLVGIQQADLNGANAVTVVPSQTNGVDLPLALALDVAGGKVYWSDFTFAPIRRSNLDGSDMEEVLTPSSGDFYLALDTANRTVYWEDDMNAGTGVRRQQIAAVEAAVSGLLSAGGMTVHGDQLYYVDTDMTFANLGAGSIHRIEFDGSNDVPLVSNLQLPYDIEIDPNAGKMYWSDILEGIQRANLNGTSSELVLDTDFPVGMELDVAGEKMYWVNAITGDIARANLDGTGEELAITDIAPVTAIAYHAGLGKMYAVKDGLGLVRANLDGSDPEDIVGPDDAGDPAAIKFDTVSGKMYWTQIEGGQLRRANLDGTNVEVVIDALFPVGEFALAIQTNEEVWVDFAHTGNEIGSEPNPFNTLLEGLAAVLSGGTIFLAGDSADTSSSETMTITQAVTLQADGGTVTIGESEARAVSTIGFVSGTPE